MKKIKVGTRGSLLALVQADLFMSALKAAHPGLDVEIVPIKTLGDYKQGTKQAEISDKQDWVQGIDSQIIR